MSPMCEFYISHLSKLLCRHLYKYSYKSMERFLDKPIVPDLVKDTLIHCIEPQL